ncbi:hypothetical protein HZY91_10560 [Facklamia sp. DSM 111018]|uniref:Polymerase beta nucleotidyltransferase domain-containing protein n=2 Tax=Facklamia lactis TaxID=2749967 RepID=A0ABS0LT92_9LACT|nr:hypothetical protein [Facklamia lactis]
MNEDIRGLFYGGSIGRNDSDQFSDMDARIVLYSSETIHDIKKEILDLFSHVLFIEENNNSFMVIHLEDFKKIDIFFYTAEQLIPSLWLKDILIIKDDDNIIKQIKEESKLVKFTISEKEIIYILNKYLACLLEIRKRYERNEWFYLELMINQMANILSYLWYIEKGSQPNALGDWSKYQGSRSKLTKQQLNILDEVKCNNDFKLKIIMLNKNFEVALSNIMSVSGELDVSKQLEILKKINELL